MNTPGDAMGPAGARVGPGVVRVRRLDYGHADDAALLVALLDAYARDPAGGGEPLGPQVRSGLAEGLGRTPGALSLVAEVAGQPAGLINLMAGFSTFAARPLLNIHDLVVLPAYRGAGVGEALLRAAEAVARERGACKITLEVLQGNVRARRLYERLGFAGYALDPSMGVAEFMQKKLT